MRISSIAVLILWSTLAAANASDQYVRVDQCLYGIQVSTWYGEDRGRRFYPLDLPVRIHITASNKSDRDCSIPIASDTRLISDSFDIRLFREDMNVPANEFTVMREFEGEPVEASAKDVEGLQHKGSLGPRRVISLIFIFQPKTDSDYGTYRLEASFHPRQIPGERELPPVHDEMVFEVRKEYPTSTDKLLALWRATLAKDLRVAPPKKAARKRSQLLQQMSCINRTSVLTQYVEVKSNIEYGNFEQALELARSLRSVIRSHEEWRNLPKEIQEAFQNGAPSQNLPAWIDQLEDLVSRDWESGLRAAGLPVRPPRAWISSRHIRAWIPTKDTEEETRRADEHRAWLAEGAPCPKDK